MLNTVALVGFVSRPPRRFGDAYFFPLAVYRDPKRNDRQGADTERDRPDFPPVIVTVSGADLPPFVQHRTLVRVEGWIRTRNRTEPLAKRVRKDLMKAGLDSQKAYSIAALIPADMQFRTVEVEVIAERIWPAYIDIKHGLLCEDARVFITRSGKPKIALCYQALPGPR